MIVFVWKEMFTCMYVQLTKYKITFFTSLLNIIIKVFAMSLMWKAVYIQNASSSELNLDQMLIYSTMSIAISQCLTWWEDHIFLL